MESKTPGVSHLMVGVPGKVKNWLQTEQGVGSLLTNPAALSGVAGLMAQVAGQQTMAEITNYLDRIDAKVDDVLGKVDDTVLKDMRGARFQIRRAQTMRDQEGRVTSDSWSEVQNASGKLADVQGTRCFNWKQSPRSWKARSESADSPLPPKRRGRRSRSGSRSWRTASAYRSPSTFWHSTRRWTSLRLH